MKNYVKEHPYLVLGLLFALLFLAANQLLAVTDSAESNYALTAKEMIQSGDWLSPQIYGHYWYDKPIFYYWELALSFRLFGINEWAARFPAVVTGILNIWFVFWFASRYEQLKGSGKKKHTGPLSLGGITMDESTHTVTVRGKPVELANKEFQLLHFLMVNAGIVFSRDTLYNRIWGMESLGNTATVPVHINRIREAVEEDPSNPKHILTIWGVGYKFQV